MWLINYHVSYIFLDDYFSDWLEEDRYPAKHTPVYFLGRHGQKVRRVKHHLKNYMFDRDGYEVIIQVHHQISTNTYALSGPTRKGSTPML